jgi:hypothetical protein
LRGEHIYIYCFKKDIYIYIWKIRDEEQARVGVITHTHKHTNTPWKQPVSRKVIWFNSVFFYKLVLFKSTKTVLYMLDRFPNTRGSKFNSIQFNSTLVAHRLYILGIRTWEDDTYILHTRCSTTYFTTLESTQSGATCVIISTVLYCTVSRAD